MVTTSCGDAKGPGQSGLVRGPVRCYEAGETPFGGKRMRQWIVFGCGAIALGAAAWYLGKPAEPPASPPAQPVVAVAQAESPKEAPATVIEVIDLARAYEPVPEPEEVAAGMVDPATFIPVADAPARIPYAATEETHWVRDLFAAIRRTPLATFLIGPVGSKPEPIDVMPREVKCEKIGVMPREVRIVINREEQERQTGVREDALPGVIGP
jgi:hypothetical protein